MASHTVFIEAHMADEDSRRINLVVICDCGSLLMEQEGDDVHTSLDLINIARFSHHDQDIRHTTPVCEICGEDE